MDSIKERIRSYGSQNTAKLLGCSRQWVCHKAKNPGEMKLCEIRQMSAVQEFSVAECFEIVNGRKLTAKRIMEECEL